MKSHCSQAPFGKGEHTLVDKKVRDTWEMDADQVDETLSIRSILASLIRTTVPIGNLRESVMAKVRVGSGPGGVSDTWSKPRGKQTPL